MLAETLNLCIEDVFDTAKGLYNEGMLGGKGLWGGGGRSFCGGSGDVSEGGVQIVAALHGGGEDGFERLGALAAGVRNRGVPLLPALSFVVCALLMKAGVVGVGSIKIWKGVDDIVVGVVVGIVHAPAGGVNGGRLLCSGRRGRLSTRRAHRIRGWWEGDEPRPQGVLSARKRTSAARCVADTPIAKRQPSHARGRLKGRLNFKSKTHYV